MSSKGLWGTESKALVKSKKTAQTELDESREENQEFDIERMAVSVLKPGQKLNCELERIE